MAIVAMLTTNRFVAGIFSIKSSFSWTRPPVQKYTNAYPFIPVKRLMPPKKLNPTSPVLSVSHALATVASSSRMVFPNVHMAHTARKKRKTLRELSKASFRSGNTM